jgi:hypothetical protein
MKWRIVDEDDKRYEVQDANGEWRVPTKEELAAIETDNDHVQSRPRPAYDPRQQGPL